MAEPIVILPEDLKPLSDKEKKAEALAHEARRYFEEKLTSAKTEAEYLKWHRAIRTYGAPELVAWMFDYGETDLNDLIADFEDPRMQKLVADDSKNLDSLKSKLDHFPPKAGFARIALKRLRDEFGRVSTYQVLVLFPKDYYVNSGSIDPSVEENINDKGHAVFFKAENPCTIHSCDDLYRSTPDDSRGVLYLPLKPLQEVMSLIQKNDGHAEYMLGIDEEGKKITQDAAHYLLGCLLGGFVNETERVRISDFWKKKGIPLP